METEFNWKPVIRWTIILTVLLIVWGLAIYPFWKVFSAKMDGEAKLAHSEYERQVQVVNAKANLQAQDYNAQAEVVRASGVAKANNIIKDSITDQYIKYLWVQTLDKGVDHQIIYVPTELGLPITEAGRLTVPAPSK